VRRFLASAPATKDLLDFLPPNAAFAQDDTPLHNAICKKQVAFAEGLIDKGADVKAKTTVRKRCDHAAAPVL
jgi:hypothetical protein